MSIVVGLAPVILLAAFLIMAGRSRRAAAALEALQQSSAALPAPEAPATLGARGAKPVHYRAFSLLRPRAATLSLISALNDFRLRAKTIKLEEREDVRVEALRLLDRFAEIGDEYAKLFDQGDMAERRRIDARLLPIVVTLDRALEQILDTGGLSPDRFDTLTRFVETRYATEQDYGLAST